MLKTIFQKIVGISPTIEVLFRKLYWRNIKLMHRFKPKTSITSKKNAPVSFDHILESLKNQGVGNGDLIIVHSSFKALKPTNLSPDQIIDALIKFIGEEGTLAMPVFRRFEEEPTVYDILNTNLQEVICTYNVEKSPIWTGILPITLSKREKSVVSQCPINPLSAIGKFSKPMMENNIKGNRILPHGENSCWKFCLDKHAIIVGIGIDLAHSLTMLRAYEECNLPTWPVKDWYDERQYKIINSDFEASVKVLDRKQFWGMYYLPQIKMRKDLLKNNILKSYLVEGIPVETVNSHELFLYFDKKNKKQKGYPYLIPKRYRNNKHDL